MSYAIVWALWLLSHAPKPMWNGIILGECPECSGWTMDQLRCGVDDPTVPMHPATGGFIVAPGKEVPGWHVEEDKSRTLYSLHSGGWMPSGIPVPICVQDKSSHKGTTKP